MLKNSKALGRSQVTVTEDLSKRTRESRQELRKFMRNIKKRNPERHCVLEYDKLLVDNKIYVWNDILCQVTRSSHETRFRASHSGGGNVGLREAGGPSDEDGLSHEQRTTYPQQGLQSLLAERCRTDGHRHRDPGEDPRPGGADLIAAGEEGGGDRVMENCVVRTRSDLSSSRYLSSGW